VKKPKIIFFDCWYTLFTSDFVDFIRGLAASLGVPFDHAFIKRFEAAFMSAGNDDMTSETAAFINGYGIVDPGAVAAIAAQLERAWSAGTSTAAPFFDTFPVLEELKAAGYRLGMITNVVPSSFEALRERYKLDDYFDVLFPTYLIGTIKPDPAVFTAALKMAGVTADEAMMVGDSLDADIEPALALGMRAVLLDRNNRQPGYVDRVTDLYQLLQHLEK